MAMASPLGTVDRKEGSVRLERTLPAPIGQVWDALTDAARLHAWLAPVEAGAPAEGGTFVIRMNETETATCTVTVWRPPHELRMTWDYTGEGPSDLRLQLSEVDAGTLLVLAHTQLPVEPVQYGAGWHVHLDRLIRHLGDDAGVAHGCEGDDFMAAYRRLEPRYAEVARG